MPLFRVAIGAAALLAFGEADRPLTKGAITPGGEERQQVRAPNVTRADIEDRARFAMNPKDRADIVAKLNGTTADRVETALQRLPVYQAEQRRAANAVLHEAGENAENIEKGVMKPYRSQHVDATTPGGEEGQQVRVPAAAHANIPTSRAGILNKIAAEKENEQGKHQRKHDQWKRNTNHSGTDFEGVDPKTLHQVSHKTARREQLERQQARLTHDGKLKQLDYWPDFVGILQRASAAAQVEHNVPLQNKSPAGGDTVGSTVTHPLQRQKIENGFPAGTLTKFGDASPADVATDNQEYLDYLGALGLFLEDEVQKNDLPSTVDLKGKLQNNPNKRTGDGRLSPEAIHNLTAPQAEADNEGYKHKSAAPNPLEVKNNGAVVAHSDAAGRGQKRSHAVANPLQGENKGSIPTTSPWNGSTRDIV